MNTVTLTREQLTAVRDLIIRAEPRDELLATAGHTISEALGDLPPRPPHVHHQPDAIGILVAVLRGIMENNSPEQIDPEDYHMTRGIMCSLGWLLEPPADQSILNPEGATHTAVTYLAYLALRQWDAAEHTPPQTGEATRPETQGPPEDADWN